MSSEYLLTQNLQQQMLASTSKRSGHRRTRSVVLTYLHAPLALRRGAGAGARISPVHFPE
jgi:hypothetical protein